jgi:hypothetical protein
VYEEEEEEEEEQEEQEDEEEEEESGDRAGDDQCCSSPLFLSGQRRERQQTRYYYLLFACVLVSLNPTSLPYSLFPQTPTSLTLSLLKPSPPCSFPFPLSRPTLPPIWTPNPPGPVHLSGKDSGAQRVGQVAGKRARLCCYACRAAAARRRRPRRLADMIRPGLCVLGSCSIYYYSTWDRPWYLRVTVQHVSWGEPRALVWPARCHAAAPCNSELPCLF